MTRDLARRSGGVDVLSQAIRRVSRLSWSDPLLVSVYMPDGGESALGVSHLICRVGVVVSVGLPGWRFLSRLICLLRRVAALNGGHGRLG